MAESTHEAAREILARHGLAFVEGRRPVPPDAYHELDHDLTVED